ncbi:MAG: YaaR family protein [Thermovenabulum sp.]|uniref:YaaR family protein n=1 Tax=Thermovenabulum sp. TaxID=3100335 RepID=UPI003C7E3750
MIRVNRLSEELGLNSVKVEKKKNSGREFGEYLKKSKEIFSREELDFMFKALDEQSKKLLKTQTLEDFKKYRELLRNFLKRCLELGIDVFEEKNFARFGRQKVLTAIKIIDEKILELAEQFLSENKDTLKILSLLDEIRGLIVDLYA